jgi:hypothetical protein
LLRLLARLALDRLQAERKVPDWLGGAEGAAEAAALATKVLLYPSSRKRGWQAVAEEGWTMRRRVALRRCTSLVRRLRMRS